MLFNNHIAEYCLLLFNIVWYVHILIYPDISVHTSVHMYIYITYFFQADHLKPTRCLTLAVETLKHKVGTETLLVHIISIK